MEGAAAIVVGGMDLGESDRLVRLLTPDRGRVAVVARQARASRRRFAGAFELGNTVRYQARGRGDLPAVTEVDLVRVPIRARDDLDRLAHLAFGCEVVAGLAPEHLPAERLYGLLSVWLEVVEADPPPGAAARCALEAKALTFAGVGPRLVTCARCGEAMDDPAIWNEAEGGALHSRCGGGRDVATEDLRVLEALRRTPLLEACGHAPPRLSVLTDAVEAQLGRRLASRGLLTWGATVSPPAG